MIPFKSHNHVPIMRVILLMAAFVMSCADAIDAATPPVYERIGFIADDLFKPSYIAVDANERIYVSETAHHRLSVYSPNGYFIKSLDGLSSPSGVAVDSTGRIYVGNALKANVEVYDPDFNLLSKLGSGDGEFGTPCGMTTDSLDRIYVADCGAHKIKVYNPDGSLNFSFGIPGNSTGQFNKPSSVAVDEHMGEIMVVDTRYASGMMGSYQSPRIQVFNMSGVYKRIFGARGVAVGKLFRPVGITIDNQSRVYVTDAYQNVVQVFSNTFASLGVLYEADVAVRTPLGITISDNNRLYYASINTGTVEMYGIDSYISMDVSPVSMSFQEPEKSTVTGSRNIQILNNGSAAFSWTASSSKGWITLSQTAGSLNPSEAAFINVGLDLAGLSVGTYTGSIEIMTGSGMLETVDVTLTVTPAPLPELSVSPSSLTFTSINGSVPSAQALTINNTGGGTLGWTASADRAWILQDRAAGTAPDSIHITVDPSSMAEGTYTGSITVTAQGASGSPVTVPVRLDVIWLTGAINVVTNNAAATFTISGPVSYAGSGTGWTATNALLGTYIIVYGDIPGYITPPPESGTLEDNGTIFFNGQYEQQRGTIRVTTNYDAATFTISGPASYSGSGTNWTVNDAPAGTYEIAFNDIPGYITPLNDTQALGHNGVIGFDGHYTQIDKSIIVGAGPGELILGFVAVFDADGNGQGPIFDAHGLYYGAHVAAGDVDGDGLDEIITAPGPSISNHAIINVFDRDRNLLPGGAFTAMKGDYGANVASADFDGNGRDEVIVGAGAGAENHADVKVFVYDPVQRMFVDSGINLLAYETFHGVNISAGDIDGDGSPELITSPGYAMKNTGRIRIWDVDTSSGVGQWSASFIREFIVQSDYDYSVSVASGDVNGDGYDEIITGDGPHRQASDIIRVFDRNGVLMSVWQAGTSFNGYGAKVAGGDLDNDGYSEIIVAPGPGPDNTAFVKIFTMNGTERGSFVPFNIGYGANVAIGSLGLQ